MGEEAGCGRIVALEGTMSETPVRGDFMPIWEIVERLTGRQPTPEWNINLSCELFAKAHVTGHITEEWIERRLRRRFAQTPLPEHAFREGRAGDE